MTIKIKECSVSLSEQRIEVRLTNDLEFTVVVNKETGKVMLLCDKPFKIGDTVDTADGHVKMVVSVNYYGYPSD